MFKDLFDVLAAVIHHHPNLTHEQKVSALSIVEKEANPDGAKEDTEEV